MGAQPRQKVTATRRPRKQKQRPPGLLTPDEFCKRLGISRPTEDRWRRVEGITPHYKIGGRIYYSEAHIEEFMRLCERQPAAEQQPA